MASGLHRWPRHCSATRATLFQDAMMIFGGDDGCTGKHGIDVMVSHITTLGHHHGMPYGDAFPCRKYFAAALISRRYLL